jgi:hypothetical protein
MRKGWGTIALLLALAGCSRDGSNPAPPRVLVPTVIPVEQSSVVVPASVRLSDLEAKLNAAAPRELYAIDKQVDACIHAQRVGGVKITPDIGCHILGHVDRGHIRVFGDGAVLRLAMPVTATVTAKDIGKIVSKTATAAAEVRATIKLDITPDWQPDARIAIDYDWTTEPGIDFLGHRISFADKADEKLRGVIDKLQRDLPRQLAELEPRKALEKAWASGFTAINLNRDNPPVWLRVTPQRLRYGGYRVDHGVVLLRLAVVANAETFVGDRPPDPAPVPLPRAEPVVHSDGFHFIMPVVADYAQLEPVLAKALGKLAAKGIVAPGLGAVDVTFGKVTMYATGNGRMAIGLGIRASAAGKWVATTGTVWLTGVPYNVPGSQRILVRDLRVDGSADSASGRLLLAIATAPAVQDAIATAVSHDFAGDFSKLLIKIETALSDKRVGSFVLNAHLATVANGTIRVLGQGLYLPLDVTGTGDLRFAPKG